MNMKFYKILFAVFFVGIINANVSAVEKVKVPDNKADCEKLNGKWGAVGIFPKAICRLPTADAGKVCKDVSECEGTCVAELSKEQMEKVRYHHATVNTNGKCTAWSFIVGCYPAVRDGKVKGFFCQD